MHVLDPKYATVETHTGKLPTLHKGELTPLAANDFERACRHYFKYRDTAPEKQVATVLGCINDTRMNNWLRVTSEQDRVCDGTFADFMKEIRRHFLKPDWETTTRAQVLSSRMKETDRFSDWVVEMQALTCLLTGSVNALDDTRLRHSMEANMLPDLIRAYLLDDIAPKVVIDDLDLWIREVERIDEKRLYDADHQKKEITAQLKEYKRCNDGDNSDRDKKKPKSSKPNSAASTSSTNRRAVPR
ncbi:hypothetical protein DFH09DRAFT_944406 [Mycena vulgaris]|nr:hypothetical protein DFH09DRAFT_944406 [Mycena vulgaris]